jgi:subtilisin-like proprotein convertase family protein
LYAGRTLYEGQLWPHNSVAQLRYGNYRTYFYMLTSMGRSRVDLSIGTFCHENGHMLCRFPDMYDYGERDGDFEQSQGIGVYCLMGSGNHLNRGRTPSPVSGYLRDLVGWPDNQILLNSPGVYECRHGDYATLLKYETDRPNEYFILENRSQIGLDAHLPSSGLAVYHCDWLGSNEWQGGTADRHYQCGLLQADGHLDLERNRNLGDAGDLYAARPGVALAHDTVPSSRQWDGADSGLILGDIGAPGSSIDVRIGTASAGNIALGEVTADLLIPDDLPQGIQSTMAMAASGRVQSVKLRVSITHTYIGDLQVDLLAPSGKVARVHDRGGGSGDDLKATWESAGNAALAGLAGESLQGAWTLAVRDMERRDTGRLNWWSLEIAYAPSGGLAQGSAEPALSIPDADPQGGQSSIAIAESGRLADLEVRVAIRHTYRGDLLVELVAPSGRSVVLHDRAGGSADDLRASYDASTTPALAALAGEETRGEWALRVRDMASIDTGTLEAWSVRLRYA